MCADTIYVTKTEEHYGGHVKIFDSELAARTYAEKFVIDTALRIDIMIEKREKQAGEWVTIGDAL